MLGEGERKTGRKGTRHICYLAYSRTCHVLHKFLGYAQTLIFPPFLSNQTLLPIFVGQPQSKWRTFVVNFSRDPPGKEAVFGSAHSLRRKLKGGRERAEMLRAEMPLAL